MLYTTRQGILTKRFSSIRIIPCLYGRLACFTFLNVVLQISRASPINNRGFYCAGRMHRLDEISPSIILISGSQRMCHICHVDSTQHITPCIISVKHFRCGRRLPFFLQESFGIIVIIMLGYRSHTISLLLAGDYISPRIIDVSGR